LIPSRRQRSLTVTSLREPFQDDTDLVFGGVLPAGLGPDLPDESLGLLGRGLCYLGLTGVALGHFWLLSRCGRSIPGTRSPNTPPLSCFSPLKCVPLSLNAYIHECKPTLTGILSKILSLNPSFKSKSPNIKMGLLCASKWMVPKIRVEPSRVASLVFEFCVACISLS
jgi:hypothetical protein